MLFRLLGRAFGDRKHAGSPPRLSQNHSGSQAALVELRTHLIIEEYRSLRDEIARRAQYQLFILGGNVALVGATAPLLFQRWEQGQPHLVLYSPLVFVIVAWLYLEQDVFITQAATYLHACIRGRVRAMLSDAGIPEADIVLNWEQVRGQLLFAGRGARVWIRIMIALRLAASVGPGASITVALLVALATGSPELADLGPLEYGVVGVNVLLVSMIVFLGMRVLGLYRSITRDDLDDAS